MNRSKIRNACIAATSLLLLTSRGSRRSVSHPGGQILEHQDEDGARSFVVRWACEISMPISQVPSATPSRLGTKKKGDPCPMRTSAPGQGTWSHPRGQHCLRSRDVHIRTGCSHGGRAGAPRECPSQQGPAVQPASQPANQTANQPRSSSLEVVHSSLSKASFVSNDPIH